MIFTLDLFKRKSYRQLNTVFVSRNAILQNHNALCKIHPEAKICPVLKSNAYGHGLIEIASVFDSMGCPFLVVDSLFEAYELLKMKVKTRILVMGYTDSINFTVKRIPFDVVVFDLDVAKTLNRYQPGCNVHIFIDTGMNREGVQIENLQNFLTEMNKFKNLKIVGLCSHLADADNSKDERFNQHQIEQFGKAWEIMKKSGINPTWRHISASGGAYKIQNPEFNMIRAGIAHFGISPLDKVDKYRKNLELQPALEFVSRLVQVKHVQKGAVVGYSCTHKLKRDSVLGLLPAGYYEGVDRRLSNNGFVKIRDKFFPIVGRVSMNMTVVDITELDKPKTGEKVIIYSAHPEDKNSLGNSANKANAIPYELIVHIAESVKRVVI
ncbi:alanine racemase [Candidatus Amesbacteria bacterium RIFOXYB1_FULL_44_23]|uniref:Alanine racemase n=1 Tax=Candidatus Amesbacteria bacterium RIFOXYB1_FULL_44_23 TaxID=1797263 RepID=A0A1F4ZX47_9BACT|nr:MAG: alanine racemase [Candidatus Amesbacteria bacterium RIFOXYB1_FULL_44_23]